MRQPEIPMYASSPVSLFQKDKANAWNDGKSDRMLAWIGHQYCLSHCAHAVQLLSVQRIPEIPRRLVKLVRLILNGQEAVFDVQDPLPFLALHYLQEAACLWRVIRKGTPWIKLDLCSGKVVELGGDWLGSLLILPIWFLQHWNCWTTWVLKLELKKLKQWSNQNQKQQECAYPHCGYCFENSSLSRLSILSDGFWQRLIALLSGT